MYRRRFLGAVGVAIAAGAGGCVDGHTATPELGPSLEIFADVDRVESAWDVTVDVVVTVDPLSDVTVIGFDDSGSEVCRTSVGEMEVPGVPGSAETTVSMTCRSFPAIITANAAETPCDGAQIEVLYWVGTEVQRSEDLPDDVVVWESTSRRCEEPLPPERVLEKVKGSTSSESGSIVGSPM